MARILIIDDDTEMRSKVRALLERDGHDVRESADGASGIAEASRARSDLVITDVIMPRLDGVSVVRTLKQKSPALPVLVISGGGRARNFAFLELARKEGADQTLKKPFQNRELRDAVRACLRRS